MAYTYRNKKTGDVIYLNRKVNTAFWEEVNPEKETFDEEDPLFDVIPEVEDAHEEPAEEAPKKTGRSRGKK